MTDFYLSPDKRAKLTPEEMALLLLSVLKHNEQVADDERRFKLMHPPNGIRACYCFQISRNGETDARSVAGVFAQAKQLLFSRGLVYQDPTQSSDEYVCLTDKGRETDTNQPVLGITPVPEFIKRIESHCGPLDQTLKQYIFGALHAAEAELWVSTAFLLVGASERLMILLSRHIDLLESDHARSTALQKLQQIGQIKKWITEGIPALRRLFPNSAGVFKGLEERLATLETIYRFERNEAGHPNDSPYVPDPAHLKALLFSFESYCGAVYDVLRIKPAP